MSCIVSGAGLFVTALSAVGILFVLGVAAKHPTSQLLGAVFCSMLAFASINAGFIASGMINAIVLVPMCIWGFYRWRNTSSTKTLEKAMSKKVFIIYIMFIFLITGLVSLFTMGVSSLPILDALTAVLPVAATFLMVQGYREQWYMWIPYNAIQAFMWFTAASIQPAVLALFAVKLVFLVNSLIGFYNWRKGNNLSKT